MSLAKGTQPKVREIYKTCMPLVMFPSGKCNLALATE